MFRKQNKDTMLDDVEAPNDGNNDNGTTHDNNEKRTDRKKGIPVLFLSYLAIYFLAIGLCTASFKVHSFQEASLKGLRMWQWCILIAALLSGPLLSKAIVKIILLFTIPEFIMIENVMYYVLGLAESATAMLWFCMILVAWLWVVEEPSYLGLPQQDIGKIKKKYATTFHIITVTIITFILGSFLWALKDLVIMKAKTSFHIKRFFDRVKETLVHQYLVKTLSRRPQDNNKNSRVDSHLLLQIKNYIQKLLSKVRHGRKVKMMVDSPYVADWTQDNVSYGVLKTLIDGIIKNPSLIGDQISAIQAAETIFNLVGHPSHGQDKLAPKYIRRDDLRCFQQDAMYNEDIAVKYLFEGAEKVEITKWMVKVYKYRKAVVSALEANKSLFLKFNRFVNVLLVFLIFVLWLIMLGVETRKVIFLLGTAIVGSAFVFGETTKKFLENILFVFVVHPFDIGDCCLIDNTLVIIEKINFLSTTVSTFDNERKHYPNAVLSNQPISNYTRSPEMGDNVTFFLDLDTHVDKIHGLKNKINGYIKDNPQNWSDEHEWVIELENSEQDYMARIKMTLRLKHTINSHERSERQLRKSELVLEIKKALHELVLDAKRTKGRTTAAGAHDQASQDPSTTNNSFESSLVTVSARDNSKAIPKSFKSSHKWPPGSAGSMLN